MTKHVAAVWSTEPRPIEAGHDHGAQRWDDGPDEVGIGRHLVLDEADAPVDLLAATAIHDADGQPDHVVAICGLLDGSRCYARSRDADVVDLVLRDEWVGVSAKVTPAGDGTNELRC